MILRRTNIRPAVWRQTDQSWRMWAFETAAEHPVLERVGLAAVPVELVFQPLARDRRTLFHATTYWATVDLIIDGLIAAGAVSDRNMIARIVLCQSIVAGVDGLEVHVTPAERNHHDPPVEPVEPAARQPAAVA